MSSPNDTVRRRARAAAPFARVAAVAALVVASPAAAQMVRGTVGGGEGGGSVEGVLVTLLDSASAARGSAIAGADGGFRLRAPAPGPYRVLVRRIGFAPDTSAPVTVSAAGEVTVRLAVTRTRFTLAPARVVADARCGGAAPSARTLALLDQARLALELERATRAEGRFGAEIEVTGRVLDGRGGDVRRVERERRAGPTTAPFVTVAPDSIAVRGYVTRDSLGGFAFHAPDADVLLAPDFLRTHCVEDARDARGLAAVGLRTAASVPGTGLRGTLLLDTATAELRRFEFRYERLPTALRGREAGGWVEYRRVEAGRWIAGAWAIRFPIASDAPVAIAGSGAAAERVQEGRVLRVYAAGADDAVRARGALVTGVVLDSLGSGGPLAGAEVRAEGTLRSAVTDARGRFRLDSVPAGRRALVVEHPRLDSLGLGAEPRWLDVQDDDSLDVALATPSPPALRATACGADTAAAPGLLLLGSVRDARTGAPRADATVRAEWITVGSARSVADARSEWREVRTDAQGAYALCDLPVRDAARVGLSARADGMATGQVWLPPDARPPHVLHLSVAPQGGRAPAPAVVAGGRAPVVAPPGASGSAVLVGRVVGPSGEPLPGARVTVEGSDSVATTGTSGEFRLRGLPGGTQTLRVARLGAEPAWRAVDLVPAGEQRVEVRLARRAAVLPTVRVRGERSAERALELADVERRLKPRANAWVDSATYARRRGTNVLAALQWNAPRFGRLGTGLVFPILRPPTSGMCVPFVVLDDRPVDLLDITAIDPGQVASVAIFRQGMSAPPHVAMYPTYFIDDFGNRVSPLEQAARDGVRRTLGVREGFSYGPDCGVIMIYTSRGIDLMPIR